MINLLALFVNYVNSEIPFQVYIKYNSNLKANIIEFY